jgi:rubrerythrin
MKKKKKCERCGYLWFPRVSEPKNCPFCKSPRYKIKLKVGDKYAMQTAN